jgi:hypothetical protein
MSQHVLRHSGAKPTTVKCPKCGDVVVYNGNFFCNSFSAIEYSEEVKDVVIIPGTCDWALPHPAIRSEDKNVVEELYYSGAIKELPPQNLNGDYL